jgi:hypothetical protein
MKSSNKKPQHITNQSLRLISLKMENYFSRKISLIKDTFYRKRGFETVAGITKIKPVDMSGHSDGSSMIRVIKRLNPKKMILINGSADEETSMKGILNKFEHKIDVIEPTSEKLYISELLSQAYNVSRLRLGLVLGEN